MQGGYSNIHKVGVNLPAMASLHTLLYNGTGKSLIYQLYPLVLALYYCWSDSLKSAGDTDWQMARPITFQLCFERTCPFYKQVVVAPFPVVLSGKPVCQSNHLAHRVQSGLKSQET